jgi:hypothetical protein
MENRDYDESRFSVERIFFMNNQKNSNIFLWVGILLGITSTLLYVIFHLRDSKKDIGSAFVSKYINIPQENQPAEIIQELIKAPRPKIIKKDNLKTIVGIGPAIENLLNENGIFTFNDLSKKTVEDLKKILLMKNFRLANPGSWVEQANNLSK